MTTLRDKADEIVSGIKSVLINEYKEEIEKCIIGLSKNGEASLGLSGKFTSNKEIRGNLVEWLRKEGFKILEDLLSPSIKISWGDDD